MTRNVLQWGVALLLLGQGLAASALDLKSAYEAALTDDPLLKAARAAAEAGRERIPQARSQLLPSLGLGGAWNKNRLDTTAPNFLGQPTTSHDRYTSRNETLTLRQPILRRQQLLGYRQAFFQVEDSDATLEREVQNLAVRVCGAYFEALLARDQMALVIGQKETFTAQLDAARKALLAGTGTRTDIDEVQARLDMTLAQELEALQNLDYTTGQLQALINLPVTDLAPLDTTRLALLPPSPVDLQSWVERAEQNSPEIQILRARRDAARLDVDKAAAGHYPTLDAVAQWSRSDSENVTRINSQYDTKSIGVQLTVPIYSGGYVNSTVRQAVAELERNEQALIGGTRDLALRVHKEFRGMTEGVLRVQALEQAVRSANQAVVSSRKSYSAGVRTLLDTLNAEQQKRVAERDLAQARYLYVMSKVRLMSYTGDREKLPIDEINSWLTP